VAGGLTWSGGLAWVDMSGC